VMWPGLIVIPPVAKPTEPTPGALAVAAHLRDRGLEAEVLDLNLAFHRHLWSAPAGARAGRGSGATRARRARTRSPRAAAALAGPDGYRDAAAYRQALADLLLAYRTVGEALGARLSPADLEIPGWSPLASHHLARAARAPGTLPIGGLLLPLARRVLERDPAWIGVSVTFLSQALPAFGLAGWLRREGFRGPLVLGGALVGAWRRRLGPGSPVFRCWDALVAGPGEVAAEALARGEWDAPGIMAPARGVWRPPGPVPNDWAPHPIPARPESGYLAPGPVAPLTVSRGCYWRRCAFCPEAAQAGPPFRAAAPPRAVAALGSPWHSWVHLTDEAVPPRILAALAGPAPGGRRPWYGFVRPEPTLLDPRLARGLAAGGCRLLRLGVESTCQAVLDRAGKGTRAEHLGPILRNLRSAGIRTHVYLLFGLPGQTRAEAESTLEWVRRHADAITFLNLALFHLPGGSRWEAELSGRGALGDHPPEEDLSLYRPFDDPGWPRRDVRRFLAEARTDPVVGTILRRTPAGLTANHAPFVPLD